MFLICLIKALIVVSFHSGLRSMLEKTYTGHKKQDINEIPSGDQTMNLFQGN